MSAAQCFPDKIVIDDVGRKTQCHVRLHDARLETQIHARTDFSTPTDFASAAARSNARALREECPQLRGSLYAETEHMVGHRMVIIAHRLSIVSDVYLAISLERAKALSAGSFNEVRARVPAFDRQAALMDLVAKGTAM